MSLLTCSKLRADILYEVMVVASHVKRVCFACFPYFFGGYGAQLTSSVSLELPGQIKSTLEMVVFNKLCGSFLLAADADGNLNIHRSKYDIVADKLPPPYDMSKLLHSTGYTDSTITALANSKRRFSINIQVSSTYYMRLSPEIKEP